MTERDFAIKAPSVIPAGDVRIVVVNDGPVSHELLLARLTPSGLPKRTDGYTIDEDRMGHRLTAVVEPQRPGHDGGQVIHLRPGRYVIFCNMAGHYAAGMHRSFRVR